MSARIQAVAPLPVAVAVITLPNNPRIRQRIIRSRRGFGSEAEVLDPFPLTFFCLVRDIEPLFRDRVPHGRAESYGIEALQIVYGVGSVGCVGQGPEAYPALIFGRQRFHQLLKSFFDERRPEPPPMHEQGVGECGGGPLVRELIKRRPAAVTLEHFLELAAICRRHLLRCQILGAIHRF